MRLPLYPPLVEVDPHWIEYKIEECRPLMDENQYLNIILSTRDTYYYLRKENDKVLIASRLGTELATAKFSQVKRVVSLL